MGESRNRHAKGHFPYQTFHYMHVTNVSSQSQTITNVFMNGWGGPIMLVCSTSSFSMIFIFISHYFAGQHVQQCPLPGLCGHLHFFGNKSCWGCLLGEKLNFFATFLSGFRQPCLFTALSVGSIIYITKLANCK